jgi:hypothetical protein
MRLPLLKLILPLVLVPLALSAGEPEDSAVQLVKKLGGVVDRDERAPGKPVIVVYLSHKKVTSANLKELAKELAALNDLRKLDLFDTNTEDKDLKEIAILKQLQWLVLGGTRVTDAGLKHLAALQDLRELDLSDTVVTSVGLRELAALTKLERLDLERTKVTDRGLPQLAMLKKLRVVQLGGTQVTEMGISELKAALPKCRIVR